MDKIQDIIHYWNLAIAHNPLLEWGRINFDLNRKYRDFAVDDSPFGLNIKNSARHFTGGALGNLFYGQDLTNKLGTFKENTDAKRDANKSWLIDDTKIDYRNNARGIDFTNHNPKIKRKNVYDEAIWQSIRNYNKDYPKK